MPIHFDCQTDYDVSDEPGENDGMNTSLSMAAPFPEVIPAELEADTRAVLDKLTTGKPLDAETRERIRRGAARVNEELRRRYGTLDIGVPAIRELRDA